MRFLSLALCTLLFADVAKAAPPKPPEEELEKRARTATARTPGTDQNLRFVAELATALSRGNTETFLISTNGTLTWAFADRWVSETRARALYEESFSENTANNWGAFERVDRFVSDRLSLFAAAGLERDFFAGIDWRYSGQLGTSYLLWQRKDEEAQDFLNDKLQVEIGAYLAREEYTLPPNAAPDVVLGDESADIYAGRVAASYTHFFSTTASAGAGVELIEDFNDTENLVVNSTAFVAANLLDGLALKVTFLDRFDNQPADPGLKKNDLLLTAGIVVTL